MTLPEWAVIDPVVAWIYLGLLIASIMTCGIRDFRHHRKLLCIEQRLWQTEQELQQTKAKCGHYCPDSPPQSEDYRTPGQTPTEL